MKIDLRKIYRFTPMDHAAGTALPSGGDIYYECTVCNGVITPGMPLETSCSTSAQEAGSINSRSGLSRS